MGAVFRRLFNFDKIDASAARPPLRQVSKTGWGGWIRTNTVCINSAASYQLDHAPTSLILPRGEKAHGTWVHWDAACTLAPMVVLVSTGGSGARGLSDCQPSMQAVFRRYRNLRGVTFTCKFGHNLAARSLIQHEVL